MSPELNCMDKLNCVDKANKIGYRGNVPRGIEKLLSNRFSHSSTNPENLAKIGPMD